MTYLVCTECRNGNHEEPTESTPGCYGGGWDNDYDEPWPCRCWAYGHELFLGAVTLDTWDTDVAEVEASSRADAYEAQFGWNRDRT
jgi:hypothetical protein